uniref:zinc finger protein 90-like n=1 Tax=Scatophagus argus TaxID=75038 RepID=UPI001ED863EC|nr:zinc finger protein 90-like [Scatophagus argus]
MSLAECLREFVNERLTAAAEEIIGVFKSTIVQYEEEISRQRTLLDIAWKPEIRLHRIELTQQHVCKKEEDEEEVVVLAEQHLFSQERNSSLDQADAEPPQMKEEQKELCNSNKGEQLVLKQETDTFTSAPTCEENDHSEAVLKSKIHTNNAFNPTMSTINCNTRKSKDSLKCDTCGKYYKGKQALRRHLRIHTNVKRYSCSTCGKAFRRSDSLKRHIRIHTGEKPHLCRICGYRFIEMSKLNRHMRMHAGEKP